MKRKLLAGVTGAMLMAGGMLYAAKPPAANVSPHRHPNLAAAQRLARHAWQRVLDAQKANEWDMEGHAQKAKELLDQVNNELKIAAGEANEHPGPH